MCPLLCGASCPPCSSGGLGLAEYKAPYCCDLPHSLVQGMLQTVVTYAGQEVMLMRPKKGVPGSALEAAVAAGSRPGSSSVSSAGAAAAGGGAGDGAAASATAAAAAAGAAPTDEPGSLLYLSLLGIRLLAVKLSAICRTKWLVLGGDELNKALETLEGVHMQRQQPDHGQQQQRDKANSQHDKGAAQQKQRQSPLAGGSSSACREGKRGKRRMD